MRVCLIVEGAYPYVTGGMSTWVQQLMLHMPETEFIIQSIAVNRNVTKEFKYKIPENCTQIEEVYLMDDDYISDKKMKNLKLSSKQYKAFENLLFYENPDWDEIMDFFAHNDISLNSFLSGKDFLSMVLNYYEKNFERVVFTDFLWTMRSIYLPLFTILKSRVTRADLYHAASSGYAGIWGCLQKYVYHKPFILSEHGIYTREREEEIIKADWVSGIYKDLWIGQFHKIGDCNYKYADIVTSLYGQARYFQVDLGCDESKCRVLPNGSDPKRFADCPQKSPDDPYINLGALLRVSPIKDVKTMINAFALAKSKNPKLKLWIMGGMSEDEEYAQECLDLVNELNIEDVVFTGVVNAVDYMGKMDIVMLSSISEGQPLTILEAFTAKKPFIATDVGNCRGLIEGEVDDFGPGGIIVPMMNPTRMAEAILKLADDEDLRKKMGEAGYKRVCMHYDENDCYQHYADLYKELTEEKA